jgi:hypothetical protein
LFQIFEQNDLRDRLYEIIGSHPDVTRETLIDSVLNDLGEALRCLTLDARVICAPDSSGDGHLDRFRAVPVLQRDNELYGESGRLA